MWVVGETLPHLARERGSVQEHLLGADPLPAADARVERKLNSTLEPVVVRLGAVKEFEHLYELVFGAAHKVLEWARERT